MNNLEMMRKRFEWQGGIRQENRMIKDKWRTLQRALKYSYQACTIQKVQSYDECLPHDWPGPEIDESLHPYDRALINSDKVKQEYDDKIVSVNSPTNKGTIYVPGDTFKWHGTDSYWIIYTQELTEDAYFRGEIRRCKHRIKFKDEDGNWWSTWAAVRGPVETQINSIQKNQERIDRPNLSLNILMPNNPITLRTFDRYKKFLFAGRCWRVEAPDTISMINIIEINAEEDYVNVHTDDVKQEMKDGLIIEPIDPSPKSGISGNTFIKPKIRETFSVDEQGGTWKILENVPVKICKSGNKQIQLIWDKMVSGQFTLEWSKGDKLMQKIVVVESLY